MKPHRLPPFPACLPKSPFSVFQSNLWLGFCFQADVVRANKEHMPADPPSASEGSAGRAAAPWAQLSPGWVGSGPTAGRSPWGSSPQDHHSASSLGFSVLSLCLSTGSCRSASKYLTLLQPLPQPPSTEFPNSRCSFTPSQVRSEAVFSELACVVVTPMGRCALSKAKARGHTVALAGGYQADSRRVWSQ